MITSQTVILTGLGVVILLIMVADQMPPLWNMAFTSVALVIACGLLVLSDHTGV